MDENAISKVIVDSAIEVHPELGGPGLLESVYEEAPACEPNSNSEASECRRRGARPSGRRDVSTPRAVRAHCSSRSLLRRERRAPLQLIYLRLTKLKLGLVINFGEQFLTHGIHRAVNGL